MSEIFANGAVSTLSSTINNTDLSLTVASGSAFSTPAAGEQGRIVLDNEIIIFTGRSGNVLSWPSTAYRGAEGTSAASHTAGATVTQELTAGGVIAVKGNYIHIRDEKTSGVTGGTFTSGAWRTRDLNTEVSDTGGLSSVASNQITLAAGTYRVRASAPAYSVNEHQLRLYNVTDSAVLIQGSSSSSPATNPNVTQALLSGRFTITGTKTIELQHQCATTFATYGFGDAASFGLEVYAVVELWAE